VSQWIDLPAVARIVVAALVFGAGIPATFGLGLRLLSATLDAGSDAAGRGRRPDVGAHPVAAVLAGACFAAVLGVAGWGCYLVVSGR
jgi:hypothetical protein